jgi:large subunit ribosomal protein L13
MLRRTLQTLSFKGVLRRTAKGRDGLPEYKHMSKQWLCREGERWWLLDCNGQQVRQVAHLCMLYMTGQHRPDFRPGMMQGDNIVCINTKDLVMTGDQWLRTPYEWSTPWPAGKYRVRASDMFTRDPSMVLYNEVRMKVDHHFRGKLKTHVAPLENLWLYEDAVHPHGAKGLRPLAWNPSPVYSRWTSPHNVRRWSTNEFMQ